MNNYNPGEYVTIITSKGKFMEKVKSKSSTQYNFNSGNSLKLGPTFNVYSHISESPKFVEYDVRTSIGKRYRKGPKGGKYYFGKNGNKIYV